MAFEGQHSTRLWRGSGRRMKTRLSVTSIFKGCSEHQDDFLPRFKLFYNDSFLPFHPLSKIAPESYSHLNRAA